MQSQFLFTSSKEHFAKFHEKGKETSFNRIHFLFSIKTGNKFIFYVKSIFLIGKLRQVSKLHANPLIDQLKIFQNRCSPYRCLINFSIAYSMMPEPFLI